MTHTQNLPINVHEFTTESLQLTVRARKKTEVGSLQKSQCTRIIKLQNGLDQDVEVVTHLLAEIRRWVFM